MTKHYNRRKKIAEAIIKTETEIQEVATSKVVQALTDFEADTSTDSTRTTNPVDTEDLPLVDPTEEE